jgi:hypothetical protein
MLELNTSLCVFVKMEKGEWKKFSTSLLSCTLIDVPLHQTVGVRLHEMIGRAVFCVVNGGNCVTFCGIIREFYMIDIRFL